MSWRKPYGDGAGAQGTVLEGQREEISEGSTQYIGEKGGNDAPPTFQDASGAPIENNSPLGYSVGPVTITLLNITMMIGAGIYSTRTFCTLSKLEFYTNCSKHPRFCPEPVLLELVLFTGLLVTWYVLDAQYRDATEEQ